MNNASTGHGNRAAKILQPVVGLIDNRRPGGFLFVVLIIAAALDHEAIDHPMEDGALIKP